MAQLISYLTFIQEVGRDLKARKLAKYRCVCGKEIIVLIANVNRLNTKSCGCKRYTTVAEKRTTHGLCGHALYSVWSNMKRRCYDLKCPEYKYYGAIGVIICEEWRKDFKRFYDWAISNGWERGLQVDKDKLGNGLLYSPGTCCLLTAKENCNNRKDNRFIEVDGVSKTVSQWNEHMELPYGRIANRLAMGWNEVESVVTPLLKTN